MPFDLTPYPEWQKLVASNKAYRKAWLEGRCPPLAWEEGHGAGQKPWTPDQPSRGLGDTVAKITSAVGIKPCGGCKERQAKLNRLVPYKATSS